MLTESKTSAFILDITVVHYTKPLSPLYGTQVYFPMGILDRSLQKYPKSFQNYNYCQDRQCCQSWRQTPEVPNIVPQSSCQQTSLSCDGWCAAVLLCFALTGYSTIILHLDIYTYHRALHWINNNFFLWIHLIYMLTPCSNNNTTRIQLNTVHSVTQTEQGYALHTQFTVNTFSGIT